MGQTQKFELLSSETYRAQKFHLDHTLTPKQSVYSMLSSIPWKSYPPSRATAVCSHGHTIKGWVLDPLRVPDVDKGNIARKLP